MQGGTDWRNGFIAVDWGTTNRRAWLLDGAGAVVGEMEDGCGILSVPEGGFGPEIESLRARFGAKPLLLAGMVGSNRGWIEASYVPAPATLDDLVAAIRWAAPGVGIVPGVSFLEGNEADVMRGEEVQILGALAGGLVEPGTLVCHPGTHAKWIRTEGSTIGRFRTMMTGELFSLLKKHSILSDLLQEPVTDGPAFAAGVAASSARPDLAGELFSVRARFLLGLAAREDCASYASGVLIGADVANGVAMKDEGPVVLIGRPDLTRLYASAVRQAGRDAAELDGEQAFLAGAKAIAERL